MGKAQSSTSENSVELVKELGERTLDHQVDAIREKGHTAIELVKVNLLLATIVIAILKFGTNVANSLDDPQHILITIFPLIFAILFAMLARFYSESTYGLNDRGLSAIQSNDEVNIKHISEGYIDWANKNQRRIKWANQLIAISVFLTTFSLGILLTVLFLLTNKSPAV